MASAESLKLFSLEHVDAEEQSSHLLDSTVKIQRWFRWCKYQRTMNIHKNKFVVVPFSLCDFVSILK
jgi:hypothetical protein